MNRYSAGNEVLVRFYFAIRPLTQTEETRFYEGAGLPSGVGHDPTTAQLIYTPPEGEETTLEGTAVVKDGVGAYHAFVLLAVGWDGAVPYKGRGLNAEGIAVITTKPRVFTVGP